MENINHVLVSVIDFNKFLPSARNIRLFKDSYPGVMRLWYVSLTISLIIAIISTIFSTQDTRGNAVQPLLIGVITLFTISLTVSIMGIRVASNRYSHRVDSIIFQNRVGLLHFLPHISAIVLGIFLISTSNPTNTLFLLYIFVVTTSIVSIFPFMNWLLITLSPQKIVKSSFDEIDEEYLNKVEQEVDNIVTKAHGSSKDTKITDINDSISYLNISHNDPVDTFSDIAKSRIASHDISTVMKLLEDYDENIQLKIEKNYRNFKITSHSSPQLVSQYLYSPYQNIFEFSVKEKNRQVCKRIVTLVKNTIVSWPKNETDGMPEVLLRTFSSLSYEYILEFDSINTRSVARQYSDIGSVIAEDIVWPSSEISNAMIANFEKACLNFALKAIEREKI